MTYKCSKCGKEFTSVNLRDSHSRKRCRTSYKLRLHDGSVSTIQRSKEGFKCPVSTCSTAVSRGDSLGIHYNGAHAEKPQEEKFLDENDKGFCITPDLMHTSDIFTNANLCIVHHYDLVLLVCLSCHFAMRNISARSIIKHVKRHGNIKRYQSDTMVVFPSQDELASALGHFLFTSELDLKLLQYTKHPTNELLQPVPGIMIWRGFSCNKCIYYCKCRRTMTNHRGTQHKDILITDVKKDCQVQALFDGVGLKYYGVEEKGVYGTGVADAQSMQELIMKRFTEDIESWQDESLTPPVEELTPWLRLSKWNHLAMEFMPNDAPFLNIVAQMQALPKDDKTPLSYLHTVVSNYMQKLQDFLTKGVVEYRLRRMVMRSHPADTTSIGLNNLFHVSSVERYCEVMTSFLLCLLRSSTEETVSPDYVIYTNRNDLKDPLQKLRMQLNTLTDDSVGEIDISVIHRVLLLLWTPEKSYLLRATKSTDCVFTRFFILESL